MLPGFARRFWQASHDHRGTPDAPGARRHARARPGRGKCAGVAWRIPAHGREALLAGLDEREKDGYGRRTVEVLLERRDARARRHVDRVRGQSVLGRRGLPDDELAALIATRRGPSGTNADYLFALADALRELGIADDHVHGLERRVRAPSGA